MVRSPPALTDEGQAEDTGCLVSHSVKQLLN